MHKYIIERDVPGAGKLSVEELKEASRASNAVRQELGPDVLQWRETYITDDKIFCVYLARDEEVLLEHSRCLDLPANRISRVRAVADPTSADGAPALSV